MAQNFSEGDSHMLPREAQHLQFTAPDFSPHSQFVALPAGGSALDRPELLLVRKFSFVSHKANIDAHP